MQNRHKPAIAAAAAVTATAGALALHATVHDTHEASAAATPRTLTLSIPWDDRGKTRFIDHGKKGESPGDLYLTSGVPVRDERTGRRAGELDAWEMILSMDHNGTVFQSGAIHLQDGSLQGAGIIRHTDGDQPESLTAGTGAYANVRGQVTNREDPRRKRNILEITLLP
jgi:hypothetical protein